MVIREFKRLMFVIELTDDERKALDIVASNADVQVGHLLVQVMLSNWLSFKALLNTANDLPKDEKSNDTG